MSQISDLTLTFFPEKQDRLKILSLFFWEARGESSGVHQET